MRVNDAILAILGWISKFFKKADAAKPLESPQILLTKTEVYGESIEGVLQLLSRDTPRAVRTWRYKALGPSIPTHKKGDILICLDTVEALPNEQIEPGIAEIKEARYKRKTHQITIVRSHYSGDESGAFEVDELFSAYYSISEGRWAIAAIDNLAHLVAYRWWRSEFYWETEILASVVGIK